MLLRYIFDYNAMAGNECVPPLKSVPETHIVFELVFERLHLSRAETMPPQQAGAPARISRQGGGLFR